MRTKQCQLSCHVVQSSSRLQVSGCRTHRPPCDLRRATGDPSRKGDQTMSFTKILRLGLIHVAVAITLVPINGTLNRIMIGELGLAATLVAILISLPYLFSPLQVWIGGYSDRHPLWGYRRTP